MYEPPQMNYPLEVEIQQIGRWSCLEIRAGKYKYNCNNDGCKHGVKPCDFCKDMCTSDGFYHKRPSTLYEKMDDSIREFHLILGWIFNVEERLNRLIERRERFRYNNEWGLDVDEERIASLTPDELQSYYCIIRFQIQAYRRILFGKREHRLIWSLCPICKEKRFFYRLPNIHRHWLNKEYVDVDLKRLNPLFKCPKCHYVEYEGILDINSIAKPRKDGIEGYINSKEGLRKSMAKMDEMMSVVEHLMWYHDRMPECKDWPLEKFMIITEHPKGGIGYQCICCKYIYKYKHLAKIHLKNFWAYTNEGINRSCMKGIVLRKNQLLELVV